MPTVQITVFNFATYDPFKLSLFFSCLVDEREPQADWLS